MTGSSDSCQAFHGLADMSVLLHTPVLAAGKPVRLQHCLHMCSCSALLVGYFSGHGGMLQQQEHKAQPSHTSGGV